MIVSKTPFRIPICGGGTDLNFYWKKRGALLISATFNQYYYVMVKKRELDKKILVQTTNSFFSTNADNVKHFIIKAILKYFRINNSFHIVCASTLPTQSGIGSSSSLIIGLVHAISYFLKKKISSKKLGDKAFFIERKLLGLIGGFQDQYAAAYGGFTKMKMTKKGKLTISKIKIEKKKITKLENHLCLIYTKGIRNSGKIIKDQKKEKNLGYYDKIKSLVKPIEQSIKDGKYRELGRLFNIHWKLKQNLSKNISNKKIDKMYGKLINNKNFIGGKIMGAGGGGFLLMVVENKKNAEIFLKKNKFNFTSIKFTESGSKIIQNDINH